MTNKQDVQEFLAQKTLAIVGMSRNPNKFGSAIYKELTAQGYRLFPIHPEATTLQGVQTYPNLKALPEAVGGVIIVVPPTKTEQVVKEAAEAGIRRVWMQQGAESEAAIRFCQENGIKEVHGECIIMFSNAPAFYHKLHRWIWKVVGKMPQ